MRAIAAIPPYASRPNSWPNKTDFARYEKYFPDGGGRRGRRPIGIIPRWTGKAIALPPSCVPFKKGGGLSVATEVVVHESGELRLLFTPPLG